MVTVVVTPYGYREPTVDEIIERRVWRNVQVANMVRDVSRQWRGIGWRKRLLTRVAKVLGVLIEFK